MDNTRYYGIDIGDGETAGAWVSADAGLLPRVVTLGSTKSMLSVVGTLNGQPVVGDQALLQPGVTNISARFKSRYLTDPGASQTISLFARGLYEHIKGDMAGASEVHVALGVPAGWTKGDRQKYAAIVGAAGFPNLHTVAESRAAFLYARYDTDIGLSPEALRQPALVIDIGSSTTDFAYIVDGKESEVGVFGNVRLGGGLLDRLILDDAVDNSPKSGQIRAVFSQYPSWRSLCELEARKLKEKYFSAEDQWAERLCVTKIPIYADVNAGLSLTISLNRARMERLLKTPITELGDIPFPERLRQSLDLAAKNTATYPPMLLILTGGASRMAFFRQACRDAFPQANVVCCKEPEFSIARGLAIAARMDQQLSIFRQEIEAFFAGGALRKDIDAHLPTLQEKLTPVLQRRIMTRCVTPALQQDFRTWEQLKTLIHDNIKKEFQTQSRTTETDKIIADWIGTELTVTQQHLDEICVHNDMEKADMSMSRIGVNIKLDGLTTFPALLPTLLMKAILSLLHIHLPYLPPMGAGRRIRAALQKEMTDPGSEFTKSLAEGMETELRAQIQNNVDKVEMIIS